VRRSYGRSARHTARWKDLSDRDSGAVPAAQNAANLESLRKGLRDLGYVEGRNLVIEYRSADGRAERFLDLDRWSVDFAADQFMAKPT
jgi:putative ABC transport system substrate-binding protein